MSVVQNLSLVINESSSSSSRCGHWFVRYGVCIACKSTIDKGHGRAFNYLSNGLQLSHEAVAAAKHFTTLVSCSNDKKLHLVLDLDHTLLHTTQLQRLTEADKYLIHKAALTTRDDLWEWTTQGDDHPIVYYTKLRPFVHGFLQEANEMFTMCVYTMGNRGYANLILDVIDPSKIYFEDRVITRDESPYMKTLGLVLAHERGTLIVDDRPDVWPDHKSNGEGGVGWVLRDHLGCMVWAGEKRVAETGSMLEMEAEALRWATLILAGFGYRNVTFESDSEILTRILRGYEESWPRVHPMIQEIRAILASFSEVEVVYYLRSGNKVANRIAKETVTFTFFVSKLYYILSSW